MIVSRITLSKEDMLRLKYRDVYSLHKLVYGCFPLEAERGSRGESASFLFADNGIRQGHRQVIILSKVAPIQPERGTLVSKTVPPGFLDHEGYRFSLTINPVRRENASRKIRPVVGHEAILQWFRAKAPNWGFGVDESHLEIADAGVWEFNKQHDTPVTIAYATIQGTLRVTQREAFVKSFTKGIGRARAFGCGLLQLVPTA